MEYKNGNGSQSTISIRADRYEALAQCAAEQGKTVEAVVDKALTEFLDEQN